MKKMRFFYLFLLFAGLIVNAQVGIGTTTPNASSMLDIVSTNRGVLIPRMTTAQRTAIAAPAAGLQVYDTTTNTLWYRNATTWVNSGDGILTASNGLTKTGTNVTLGGTLTAATTVALGANALNLTSTGGDLNVDANTLVVDASLNRVGIGTAAPTNDLSFGGEAARTISVVGRLINTANGSSLSLRAGNVLTGATNNLVGGSLILSSGQGVGTGGSTISFQTATPAGATANTPLNALSTKMTILGNGNVGIGTTAPATRLHVNGTVRFQSLPATGIPTDRFLTIDATDNVRSIAPASFPNIYNANGTLSASRVVTMGLNNLSFTSGGGDINFDSNTLFIDSGVNRIGIGTNLPTNDLTFGGEANRSIVVRTRAAATASGTSLTIRGGEPLDAGTNNLNAGGLVLQAGRGLGTGASNIIFQTATPALGTNNAYNALTTKMTIAGDGEISGSAGLHVVYDLKHGLQTGDHNGWYLLNGRACSTFTAGTSPRTRCEAKWGAAGSLPNANTANGASQASATYFGNIDGNTATVAGAIGGNSDNIWGAPDLPNHTHFGTTSNNGNHTHNMQRSTSDDGDPGANFITDPGEQYSIDAGGVGASGDHNHQVQVSQGGANPTAAGATPTTPRTLDANAFVYLGL